jgi:hypothetical protein
MSTVDSKKKKASWDLDTLFYPPREIEPGLNPLVTYAYTSEDEDRLNDLAGYALMMATDQYPATPGSIALLTVNALHRVRPDKLTEFFGHHRAFVKLLTGELPQKGENQSAHND